jgi:hypothetical protein
VGQDAAVAWDTAGCGHLRTRLGRDISRSFELARRLQPSGEPWRATRRKHGAKTAMNEKPKSEELSEDQLETVSGGFSFGVEREMKESGEIAGTEDINIGVGELQECTISKVAKTTRLK